MVVLGKLALQCGRWWNENRRDKYNAEKYRESGRVPFFVFKRSIKRAGHDLRLIIAPDSGQKSVRNDYRYGGWWERPTADYR